MYSFFIKVKPEPNSFKKFGISSRITFCNTFSEIISLLVVFLIAIGFLIKSTTDVSFEEINFSLVLLSNRSYSLFLIRSRSCLTDRFCSILIFT